MIPFTRPIPTGRELTYLAEVVASSHWQGDGPQTAACHKLIRHHTAASYALLTTSCTTALEMACLLADLKPGDEVVMPSWTFASSANAVALRGAVPVFVDILPDTLCLDPARVIAALTPRTKAIMPVHYAGVIADMNRLTEIAREYDLTVIEDAAQSYLTPRTSGWGSMLCYSFHATKNVPGGEAGAFVTNDLTLWKPAEIVREKGTDRGRMLRGEVDKYGWCGLGSSCLPGEVVAAVVRAQLEQARETITHRLALWNVYADAFGRPSGDAPTNGHIYWLRVAAEERGLFLRTLRGEGVEAQAHFTPLHSSRGGWRYGRTHGSMRETDRIAGEIVRLPLHGGMTVGDAVFVAEKVRGALRSVFGRSHP